MSLKQTKFQQTVEKLRNEHVPHQVIDDQRGDPYYIVSYREGTCPPREAEKFYEWGLRFSSFGDLIGQWGPVPGAAK